MFKMLKYFFAVLVFTAFNLNAICQPIIESERVSVIKLAEQYARSLIESWGCSFSVGSTVISNKEVLGDNYIYNGKVGYQSSNCGSVNANLRIEFGLTEDDLYLSRICIQMPYCAFGTVLRYDNECRDYNQKVDNFLHNSSKPQTSSTPSDIDTNIPQVLSMKNSSYALVIGNEDYSTFQQGLSKEVNVDFAINDAKVFAEYCVKTLGIPERQVKTLINATAAQIKQGLAWLTELASIENGQAELIFYYSGHGLPHENSREPYLIPVDVSAGQLDLAIPLAEVFQKLNQYPVKRNFVFLDACFSGGARNTPLLTAKGVKVVPKKSTVRGNMVMLSSSSNEESSGVYSEKQHGYFTYYLLKKIQETSGNVSLGQLFDYVQRSVLKESTIMGKKQTPSVSAGIDIADSWENWTIN